MEWLATIVVVACIVAGVLYKRKQERDLVWRIDQARGNPGLVTDIMDAEIAKEQAEAEFWKRQSGKRL